MDKFDMTMKKMMSMTPEERMSQMQMYMNMCACRKCDSYMDCSKMGKDSMFCLTGPSMCITEMNDCSCTTCTLKTDLMMKDRMYCMKGSEFETRYMQKMN